MPRATWRRFAAPGTVFVVALAVRCVHLYSITDLGFFTEPLSDARVFVDRAAGIAAGDWLGPADFVHAPFYAYFLGLLNLVGPAALWWPRIIQSVCGALACVSLWAIGCRLWDRRAGLLAGLALALYPPAIFFDGLIQKASLTLSLSVLLLWLAYLAHYNSRAWRWFLVGLVLGLLALTRQNTLALVPVFLLWAWSPGGGATRRPRRFAGLATLILGLVLAVLPWAARNRVVIGDWVLSTPNLGQNFAMGNHPHATGTYLPQKRGFASAEHEQAEWTRAAEAALQRDLTPAEVSQYYFQTAVRWIQNNPEDWLRLSGKKLLMVWNAYETPDTEDYYLYCRTSPLLAALDTVFHFGVLAPLGLAGIVLTWPDRRRVWPLYLWLLVNTLGVVVFVVFARYRLPLVPVLILFAAGGVARFPSVPDRRRWWWGGLTLVVTAFVANWPVHASREPTPLAYTNHAMALAEADRYTNALEQTQVALDMDPDNVDALLMRGSVLLDMGRASDALAAYSRAHTLAPSFAGAFRGCAAAVVALGQIDDAAAYYTQALGIDPRDYRALAGLGRVRAQQGQPRQALNLLDRALAIEPTYADALLNRGNVLLMLERSADAIVDYQAALQHAPDHVDAWNNLGVAHMMRGEVDEAIACFRQVIALQPDHRAAQQSLIPALVRTGRLDEARQLVNQWLVESPERDDLRRWQQTLSAEPASGAAP